MGEVDLRLSPERLAVGHLRRADIDLQVVNTLQDADLVAELKIIGAAQDGQAVFLADGKSDDRIIGRQRLQCDAELLLISL